jgi:hypothetical protein
MKKGLILGLLVGLLLLFFIISAWAVDSKRAKLYEHPDQELDKIPVTPINVDSYPSTIKLILIPNIQNLPILIFIDKPTTETPTKVDDSAKKLINGVKELDE